MIAKLIEKNGKVWDILKMKSADDGLIWREKGKEDQAVLQVQKDDVINILWEPWWQIDTNFKDAVKNMANTDDTECW